MPRIASVDSSIKANEIISISAGDSKNTYKGSAVSDNFTGGKKQDWLYGNGGDDVLSGGKGDDILRGDTGNNSLSGGKGDDTYVFEFLANATGNVNDVVNELLNEGNDTLDFSKVDADLTFVIDANGIRTNATETITTAIVPADLNRNSNGPVYLNLTANEVPSVSNGILSGGSSSFYLGINDATAQSVSVTLTQAELDTAIQQLSAQQTYSADGLSFTAVAGKLWLKYTQGNVAFWNSTLAASNVNVADREVLNANSSSINMLLADYFTAPTITNKSVAAQTITLALGKYTANQAGRADAMFEVKLFEGGKTYTGTTNTALRNAWLADIEQTIAKAMNADTLTNDDAVLQKQANDLWQQKLAQAIALQFNTGVNKVLADKVSAEIVSSGSSQKLQLEINGMGKLAIAKSSFGDLTSNRSFNLASVKNIETIKVQENKQVSSVYRFDAIEQSFSIQDSRSEIKSHLDFSNISDDLRITIADDGELKVEAIVGTETYKINAQGIANLTLGSGKNTLIFTGKGNLPGDINLSTNATNATTYSIEFSAAYKADKIYINNTIDDFSFATKRVQANELVIEGSGLSTPTFSQTMVFESILVDKGFKGQVFVASTGSNGAAIPADIVSGAGWDQIVITGNNDSRIDSGAGNDVLTGGTGIDTFSSGAGEDTLAGGAGDDVLRAGADNDQLFGEIGADSLYGDAGDDILDGGSDDDSLYGGAGNDTYQFNDNWGQDTVIELKGNGDKDTLDFTSLGESLVHVISENNYTAGTGTDQIIIEQDKLQGGTRSTGKIIADFDANANKVVVENGQFKYIEKIQTSQGDNSFYFGNEWGPSANWGAYAAQAIPFGNRIPFLNNDRALEIDTRLTTTGNFKLVLDFRAVTDELKFTFSTADDGTISLVVVKPSSIELPLMGLDALGKVSTNKIKFTNIDKNTIIYGGREKNTFAISESSNVPKSLNNIFDFEGTIIGGSGIRSSIFLDQNNMVKTIKNVGSLLGGNLPEFFISNTVDYSGTGVAFRTANLITSSDKVGVSSNDNNDTQVLTSTLGSENFDVYYQGIKIGTFNDASTAIDLQTALGIKLTGKIISVTKSASTSEWTVSFVASEFTDEQINELVARSSEYSQNLSGFSGKVLNIDNIVYGAGANLLLGSNIGITRSDFDNLGLPDPVTGKTDYLKNAKNLGSSVWSGVASGSLMGNNTFSIGGNYVKELLLGKTGVSEKLGDNVFASGMLESMLAPWISGTMSPGLNLISGATGADTYKFEGIWGGAAILELPDLLNGSGKSLVPEGYDTFDFSKVKSDLTIEVIEINSGNLSQWVDKIYNLASALVDKMGINIVMWLYLTGHTT